MIIAAASRELHLWFSDNLGERPRKSLGGPEGRNKPLRRTVGDEALPIHPASAVFSAVGERGGGALHAAAASGDSAAVSSVLSNLRAANYSSIDDRARDREV